MSMNIIDVISKVGRIAHATWRPGSSPTGSALHYPPLVTWRFVDPDTDIRELASAVCSYRGMVEWILETRRGKWGLMPRRIREMVDAGQFVGELDAAESLMHSEPEFGVAANADLVLLAECVERCISSER